MPRHSPQHRLTTGSSMNTEREITRELESVAESAARLRRLLTALQDQVDRLNGPKPQETAGKTAARRLFAIKGGKA